LSNFIASQTYQVSGVIGAGSLFIAWIAANFVLNGTTPYYIATLLGVLWAPAVAAVALYYFFRVRDFGFRTLLFWSLITISVSYITRTFVTETQFIIPLALLLILESISFTPKKLFALLSAIMAAFLIIHVPISQFLWIGIPDIVAATTAFCNSPLWGSIRWVASTVLISAYTVVLFVGILSIRHTLAPVSGSVRSGPKQDTTPPTTSLA
jgi:hypothetical protein